MSNVAKVTHVVRSEAKSLFAVGDAHSIPAVRRRTTITPAEAGKLRTAAPKHGIELLPPRR